MNAEEFLKILQKRRSVRSYSGEPVPMEMLNMILEAGMLAPSGRAIRPYELIVVRDKQKLISLSGCRKGGAARMLAGADLAVVVVGDEERSDTWTEDCSVVMENMHLMASALGVASCWIQGRGREAMDGETTEDFTRNILQYPAECRLEAILSLSLAVTLGANLIGVAESYLNTWIAQHITFDMRNQMYRHLQKMSQRFFTSNNQGDIITRMTSDIDGVQQVITNTFTSILSNAITLIVAMTAMYRKNWILATVGIIIVPLFTIPTRKAGNTRWTLTKESQECNDEINGILNETLSVSGQMLVKLFCKEEYEYERYEEVNRRMIELNIKESMAGGGSGSSCRRSRASGPMLLYLVGGVLMMKYNEDLTVGDITVLVALLGRMYGPVNQLLNIQVDWIRSMAMFSRIFEYFDMPVEIENAPDAVIPDHAEGNVEFRHVNFSYEPDRQILKDVSFELEAGHSIAIVGPSGSGKSTLINLIPRLYDVVSGKCCLTVSMCGSWIWDFCAAISV